MKRFYFVASPLGKLLHRAATITEGNRTYCGIAMRLGWFWRRDGGIGLKRCPRCEVA